MVTTNCSTATAPLGGRFDYELSPHNGTPSGNYFWFRKRREVLRLLNHNHKRLFAERSNPCLLELGCGSGVDLFLIRQLLGDRYPSLRLIGLDGWDKNIETCESRKQYFQAENTSFITASVTDSLPFDDGSCDFIYCSEVVEHLLEPEALFKEMFRILKPGGHLLLTTPSEPNVFQASFWLSYRRQKAQAQVDQLKQNPQVVTIENKTVNLYGHVSCKTNRGWDALAKQSGFDVVDVGRGAIAYGSTHFFDHDLCLGLRFLLEAFLDVLPRALVRPFSGQLIALYRARP